MKAYSFDMEGNFVGVVVMQKDHLESKLKKKPIYLLPANSTTEEPPKCKEGEIAKWTGKEWLKVKPPKQPKVEKQIEAPKQSKEELQAEQELLEKEKARFEIREAARVKFESLDVDKLKSIEDIKEVFKDLQQMFFA